MSSADPWLRCREGNFLWLVNRELFSPELLAHLSDPARLMLPPAERIARWDELPRATELVRAQIQALPHCRVVIKRYHSRNLAQSLKDLFRGSRGQRAFRSAFALRQNKIAIATPIAVGERRCCRWLRESFLITEEIPNCKTVWEHRKSAGRYQKQRLARMLGRTLAQLHDGGFSHSDPNFNNWLVRGSELIAIDLDAIGRRSSVSAHAAAKDLYRLVRYMEPRERLWFVAQYCRSRKVKIGAREFNELCQRYIKPQQHSVESRAQQSASTARV